MVGLRAGAKCGLLDLNKVSNLHTITGLGAGTQPCIWADDAACAEAGAFKMGKSPDDAALADMAAAANHDMRFDDHIGFDDGIGGDEHRFRGDHGHTRLHCRRSEARLQGCFRGRKINAVIDPQDFGLVDHQMRNPVATVGCQGDNIGQIIFTLGVVIGHLVQQVKQQWGLYGHDPAVTQPDAPLGVGGLAMFDNAFNVTAGAPHEPAIPRRVSGFERRHRNRRAISHPTHKCRNAVCPDKRCIGKHHDGDAVIPPHSITRRGDGATGAKLFFLDRDAGIVQPLLDLAGVR